MSPDSTHMLDRVDATSHLSARFMDFSWLKEWLLGLRTNPKVSRRGTDRSSGHRSTKSPPLCEERRARSSEGHPASLTPSLTSEPVEDVEVEHPRQHNRCRL